MLAIFVTAKAAIDRTGNEGGKNRFRHDDAVKKKNAGAGEVNETGEKPAPIAAEPFADEKDERDNGDGGDGARQAGRRSRYSQNFVGKNDQPVEQAAAFAGAESRRSSGSTTDAP